MAESKITILEELMKNTAVTLKELEYVEKQANRMMVCDMEEAEQIIRDPIVRKHMCEFLRKPMPKHTTQHELENFLDKHGVDPSKHCLSCGYCYNTKVYSCNKSPERHKCQMCKQVYCGTCKFPELGEDKSCLPIDLHSEPYTCILCLVAEEQAKFGGAFQKEFLKTYVF